MSSRVRTAIILAITLAVVVLAVLVAIPIRGQSPGSTVSRIGGKPDLNGIWQALNEANYDVEMHMARPAMALRAGPYGQLPAAQVVALGAVGAVPPGPGVIEGDAIPYQPWAAARK